MADNETQRSLDAIVKDLEQFGRDLRSHVSGKVDKAHWYMWDQDLTAEQRGDVDDQLQKAITADNYKAMLARGGSLPRLHRQAKRELTRGEDYGYGR